MIRDITADSRSYRSFDESRRIEKADLIDLIETARLCPSAVNRQPLKYRLVYKSDEVEDVLALTKWGGLLKNVKLPPDGHHPTAMIVMCCDTSVSELNNFVHIDVGIAAQTVMLQACELGFGGCMIAAFNRDELVQKLRIPHEYTPVLTLALGIPDETVFICDVSKTADKADETAYYRDKAGLHFVPKRSSDDIIFE